MQKTVRGFLQRKQYLRICNATITMQRMIRGFIARRKVDHIRRTHAALTIQRYMRGWVCRLKYKRLIRLALGLQCHIRGMFARKLAMYLKYNNAAVTIQKNLRMWLCRKLYKRKLHSVIIVQSCVRRFLAQRKLKHLKKEARTVQHHITLNKGLENKIIKLQQQIGELIKENNSLKSVNNELNETRTKLDTLRGADVELKKRLCELSEKDKILKNLFSELEQERSEKMDLLTEKDSLSNKYESEKETWNAQNKELKDQVRNLKDQIENNRKNAEELLKSRLDLEKKHLLKEHDRELDSYQKIVCEKNDLESRCELLERELARFKGSKVPGGHSRSLSDTSNLSQMEDGSVTAINEMPEEDFGYGSVRSMSSRNTELGDWSEQTASESNINRSQALPTSVPKTAVPAMCAVHDQLSGDVQLMLKLQQRLRNLQDEKDRFYRRLEGEELKSGNDQKTQENFKLQELEIENSKVRRDLMNLRKAVAEAVPGRSAEELMDQFKAQEAELIRLKDECVQLRSVLANQTQGLKSIASTNYAAQDIDMSLINEDGELVLAFEAQKKINRQLEDELQTCQLRWSIEREELVAELDRLREDYEIRQKILASKTTEGPLSPNEVFMQHEIIRLTSENLELQEKFDLLAEQYRKLKNQFKDLRKRMKDVGVSDLVGTQGSIVSEQVPSNALVVRKKERKYNGMFEFKHGDEELIMKHLILDLKPQTAVLLLPGLPAYITLMCIRHTDFTNEEEKVQTLLTEYVVNVKKVLRRRQDDIETKVLWLSNTLRLVNNLKQYSGEQAFKDKNTPTQDEQCLRIFDLSEYRTVLSEMAIWIYMGMIRCIEEKLQFKAVPAILEHEAISGLSTGKRGRTGSVSGAVSLPAREALDSLLQELTNFHRMLTLHGVDHDIIFQVFKQLFYYLCASSLNNLLLRKDLCHWSKGMNIRYNLSHIEQWARDQKLNDPSILDMLAPIIQAAQLLQARKYDEDVASVCDMCNKMSVPQIVKLLNLYTPADDFEERVPLSFIRKVQQRLKERASSKDQSALLMDTKFSFPLHLPFNPSPIQLEEIEIPEGLDLSMLKKV